MSGIDPTTTGRSTGDGPPRGSVRAGGTTRPWLAAGVSVASLALQVLLLWWFAGDAFFERMEAFVGGRQFRKEALLAGVLAVLVLAHLVRKQPALYRDAPLVAGRLALQALAFLPLPVFLVTLAAGGSLSPAAAQFLTAALASVWIASWALLVPRGGSVRQLAAGGGFTLLLVAAAVVLGERLGSLFWKATGSTTLWLVELLLAPLAGAPVERPEPFVIGTRDFRVDVHAACSGYQGIALMTVLLAGYLWWFRGMLRFPRALLLVPVGVTLVYLANAVRIAALVLVGIWISPRIAVEGFHSLAGWLGFLTVGLGLIWTTARMPFFTRDPAAPGPDGLGSPEGPAVRGGGVSAVAGPSTTACLLPFLALLASTMVTGAFSTHGGPDPLYPLRVVAVAATLWALRREYHGLVVMPSMTAVGIGVAVFGAWILLAPAFTAPDVDAAAAADPALLGPWLGPAWLVARFLGYVVTVPIAEELAFRGWLARRLVSEDVESVPIGTFTWTSFIGSSIAFGLLHQGAWIPGTLSGCAFAAALLLRGRLSDAVAAHAVTNALLGVVVVTTGSWSSWG